MKEFIKNFVKLDRVFGKDEITHFHDMEIVSVQLNRENGILLEVVLKIYRLIETFQVGEKTFDRFKNANCTFEFSDAIFVDLHGFNHQNVIQDLHILPDSDRYSVHFEEIFGCDLKFNCQDIKLTEIKVYETEEKRFEPDLKKIGEAYRKTRTLRENQADSK